MQRRTAVAASLLALPAWAVAQDIDDEPAKAAAPTTIRWPTLALLDGSSVPAGAWTGTPVVVVFWATWCAFCRRHNTHVTALQRQVNMQSGPATLRVLGVAIDGDADLVRRTMTAHGHDFPVVAGQAALRRQFTPRRVVPMTCLVDARDLLRQCIPGEMAESDVLGLARLDWARV